MARSDLAGTRHWSKINKLYTRSDTSHQPHQPYLWLAKDRHWHGEVLWDHGRRSAACTASVIGCLEDCPTLVLSSNENPCKHGSVQNFELFGFCLWFHDPILPMTRLQSMFSKLLEIRPLYSFIFERLSLQVRSVEFWVEASVQVEDWCSSIT